MASCDHNLGNIIPWWSHKKQQKKMRIPAVTYSSSIAFGALNVEESSNSNSSVRLGTNSNNSVGICFPEKSESKGK